LPPGRVSGALPRLTEVKATLTDFSHLERMDRFPPAEDGPSYELQSVGRTLDDLTPQEETAPRPGGIARPVMWSFLALLALVAFVGWLLVGSPLGR
jgi:hypothetical protein